MPPTRNLRITDSRPLMAPGTLLDELPLTDDHASTVATCRDEILGILRGEDDRLAVVVGPCSVHDPVAGLDYARRLAELSDELRDDLCLVMRVYFEKPRTTTGWKGLINDPHLDGSHAVGEGLRQARQFLLDVTALGLPAGCEFLDPISPQFLSDAVTWGAIGARTTESQVHRQLASGLSMPIGFKNATGGQIDVAVDACRAAASSHVFFGVTEDGSAGIMTTAGNHDCHLILRGGRSAPNHTAEAVDATLTALAQGGLPPRVMIDASHGNSRKDHRRQPAVAEEIGSQIASGQTGVRGVMLESFLVEGRQEPAPASGLVYGQSVTDACMSWDTTARTLYDLAEAVRKRRVGAWTG